MSNNVTQKINALLDAFDSDEGINLLIQALGDPVREIRETARWLLSETQNEEAEQALRQYPYAQMQHLYTITGYSEREPGYFVISTDQKALLSNCHSEEKKGYAYATVKIWNLQTGELTHTLPFTHEHLSTGQNGQIIVGHFQQIIDVWKSWEMKRLRLTLYGSIDIGSLTVSSDGSIIACGELGPRPLGQISVWNVQTGKLIHSIQWQPAKGSCNISTVMVSPDASLLLSQDKQRYGDLHRLWNLQTGELIRAFETHPYWVADAIANTSSGGCIVSGIRDNSVKVWDINSDQLLHSFPGCSPTAMTPDGKVLAYCNDTNEIVVWDLEVDQEICKLPENPSPIRAICLSSDREWVVSYDADQTIKIYGLLEE